MNAAPSTKAPVAEESTDRIAFVHKRIQLQQQIRALKEAHEQGFALDMAIAAEELGAAAVDLAANVQSLVARKARIAAQVQMALYESDALREMVADLFNVCLHPASPGPRSAWPHGLPPAQSYPWLRRILEHYAVLIDHALTLHDEPARDTEEFHE
jgi:hypothetical protein